VVWGGNEFKGELLNNKEGHVSPSNEYYPYIIQLMKSFTTDMRGSFEQDVINGQLSKSTTDKFNNNIISTLSDLSKDSKLNTDLQNIPYGQRKLAKSIGKGKIKEGINKTFLLTGQKFFKEGFVLNLKTIRRILGVLVRVGRPVRSLCASISTDQKILNIKTSCMQ
jgi:hypothetical protein